MKCFAAAELDAEMFSRTAAGRRTVGDICAAEINFYLIERDLRIA